MSKFVKYSILCLIVLSFLMFSSCKSESWSKIEEYCYKINFIVKDIDFHTAKLSTQRIVLYNNENEIIKEIPFEDYESSIKIAIIHKDEKVIYFIISGSVDDEQGIVFINDSPTNSVLDGITTMERIGGNSYRYSTKK